ncbi:MAG: GIY-YIG nuclease family protein [Clostridiales bacterium]|nr:GIY-YIG nuclease family protein [Candidatus Cacconaster stercorequi]
MYYVYILRCKGDTLYTGITPDLVHRMRCHAGRLPGGAKYTRAHPPVALEAVWRAEDKTDAARLEYGIKKKLTRGQKEQLIAAPEGIGIVLPHLAEIPYTPIAGATWERCLEGVFYDGE